MISQIACQATPDCLPHTESLGRPHCPRCDNVLLVAEESEFTLKGHIRHSWSCDKCGNAFVTSIRLVRR